MRTREDLRAAGLADGTIDTWIRSGRLHPVFHGVLAIGHPSLTRRERWLAAVLACEPGAALSHLSAAALWEIWHAEGRSIDVSVPRSRERVEGIELHRRRNPPNATARHGIRVTTVAQTLVDLAGQLAPKDLERAYTEAQLSPYLDRRELMTLLGRSTRGVKALRALAAEDDGIGVPRNVMERRFQRIVREAGLTRPEMNAPWRRFVIDAFWRELGIAVELDSRTYHQRKADMERDRQKDRELQFAGHLALRFTAREVMRTPKVVADGCLRAFERRRSERC